MAKTESYEGGFLDITNPTIVEIQIRADSKVIWINIDGVCKFRACQIGKLTVVDQRKKPTKGVIK